MYYKSVALFIVAFTLLSNLLSAQSATTNSATKISLKVSGNFIVATDFESTYTSFGGPALKFSFTKDFYSSISMYPSLRFKNDPIKPTVLPILGAGMHIGYKSFILAMPLYYINNANKWKIAIGIGIKL